MQSMLLSAVLFGGAHAQINIACIAPLQQLQTSCCTSGQSCPPTECSTECAPRFLDFLDTYDTECDSMIQQFGLGDLRGMCEATMAAGGETDTPADCGTGRAMGLAMACAYVDPTDFCSSPCYQQLDPFARECADVVPSEVMGMIGSALGMAVSCDEAAAAGGAGAGCSVMTLPLLCSGDLPTGEDPDDLCNDPCISGLLACADNPIVQSLMDPEDIEDMNGLGRICGGLTDGGSIYGDGECDAAELEPGGQLCEDIDTVMASGDIDQMCQHECSREMIDCLDSPVLAPMRSQILPLAEACIAHLEEDAAARIGDGVCQTIDLATLCPVSTVGGEVVLGMDAGDFCSSDCAIELEDCRADLGDIPGITPAQVAQTSALMDACGSPAEECLGLMTGFIAGMQSVCCPGGVCTEALPTSCSHKCAALVVPFMGRCGDQLGSMMSTAQVAGMNAFTEACSGTTPGGGGRGGGH